MGKWSDLVWGTTPDGKDVSVKFGEGSNNQGHTLLSDGHRSEQSFTGKSESRGHDHYDGKGSGTDRGKYTGKGS